VGESGLNDVGDDVESRCVGVADDGVVGRKLKEEGVERVGFGERLDESFRSENRGSCRVRVDRRSGLVDKYVQHEVE
jgi:hypothetical protein